MERFIPIIPGVPEFVTIGDFVVPTNKLVAWGASLIFVMLAQVYVSFGEGRGKARVSMSTGTYQCGLHDQLGDTEIQLAKEITAR